MSLAEPPSIEEFYKGIRNTKTNSAPGPSGLSYNMLKSMHRPMVEQIYEWLVMLWHGRTKIASWGWRWLHLISKTVQDNLGVNDCRPIMLCDSLRKVWGCFIVKKITVAMTQFHVLEDIQHGFIAGKGTDSASILHINHMEDTQEYTGISHQSTFDLKRAFDSVGIPCQYWGLRRVGVPAETAHDMATADVGGTTVVRSPFAEFLWHHLPYQCVKTDGQYPPSWFKSTEDSALVDSFSPERGACQGGQDSPLKWVIVFDMVATGLRLLDTQEASPTYVATEDNYVYEHTDTFYADDHKASVARAEMLQKKAELVSAFCIVLGLELSEKKIRRVVQSFVHPRYSTEVLSTTVYSAGWVPQIIKVQNTGCTEFLGGIYDVDNTSSSTLEWLKVKAGIAAQCVRSKKSFSAAAKIGVLNISVLNSMVYKAINSVLSHDDLESIDSIIDDVMISTTKNMYSFPRKLLHISREFGGHGLLSFSIEAEARKLQRLFSCLRSCQRQNLAAKGLLSRAARQHGFFTSTGQCVTIIPGKEPRTSQKLYCDGPVALLGKHDMYLCRHGYAPDIKDPSYSLLHLIPFDRSSLRRYCLDNGFYTLGDISQVRQGVSCWYCPEVLRELQCLLPSMPSFDSPTLLVGQYWQPFTHNDNQQFYAHDVLRIDGRLGDNAIVTRFTKIRGTRYYRPVLGQLRLSVTTIFPRPLAARCQMALQGDGRYGRVHVRYQRKPQWRDYTERMTPKWVHWLLRQLDCQDSTYIARPYTDGSYTQSPSIQQYFRPDDRLATATAAILIKYDTSDEKSKPVLAIYMDKGEDLGIDAASAMNSIVYAASIPRSSPLSM